MLRVLVLRSNNFSGPIHCSDPNTIWPMLQIVDIASNNFTGKLPKISTWKAMMDDENEAQSELNHLQFEVLTFQSILLSRYHNSYPQRSRCGVGEDSNYLHLD
jgi:hypothetical protein